MRAKISVRVSKFCLTLLRNMRRRRKTRSIPSSFPVILLFGLVVLLRYLNVSSLSDAFRIGSQQVAPVSAAGDEQAVGVQGGESVEKGVSTEKRRAFMERRHMERRAMHRRIEEEKQEVHEIGREVHENGHEIHESGREVHESKNKDLQDTASQEKRTQNGSDRSDTVPDSKSDSKSEASRVESKATKSHEQPSENSPSTETGQKNSDANPEQATKRDDQKPERGVQEAPLNTTSNPPHHKGGIPSGARMHGKQPEFGGSLGGTADGMIRGQNVTRVSYTLFKIMKLFGFVSMIDSPAGVHTEWMSEVVERMSFDTPSFQYTGVDDARGIEKARERMREVVDGEYLVSDVEERTANGSDVVFHWTELDGGMWDARGRGYMEHIRRVMVAAKKGDNGYIVFGQFPRLDGPQPTYRKGKWVFVGEKEDPFLFNDHVRGVVPIGNGRESYMLYMTFYSLRSIPMDELKPST